RRVPARSAKWKERPRRREQTVKLHRRRRRIARGKLGPGAEPDALLHRREAIAGFNVDHRPRERGVAGAAVVAVIAALDGERQPDAERLEHIGREWSERYDRVLGIERALGRFEAPVCVGATPRPRGAPHTTA